MVSTGMLDMKWRRVMDINRETVIKNKTGEGYGFVKDAKERVIDLFQIT